MLRYLPTYSDDGNSLVMKRSKVREGGSLTVEQRTKIKIQNLIKKKKNNIVMKNQSVTRKQGSNLMSHASLANNLMSPGI